MPTTWKPPLRAYPGTESVSEAYKKRNRNKGNFNFNIRIGKWKNKKLSVTKLSENLLEMKLFEEEMKWKN